MTLRIVSLLILTDKMKWTPRLKINIIFIQIWFTFGYICTGRYNMRGTSLKHVRLHKRIGNGGLQVNGENNTSIVTKDPIERDGIPWLVDTTNEAFKHIHKNVYIYYMNNNYKQDNKVTIANEGVFQWWYTIHQNVQHGKIIRNGTYIGTWCLFQPIKNEYCARQKVPWNQKHW